MSLFLIALNLVVDPHYLIYCCIKFYQNTLSTQITFWNETFGTFITFFSTASNVHCEGSTCCRGCGPQEQFYGCADVAIKAGTPDKTDQHPATHVSSLSTPQAPVPAPGWIFGGGNQGNTLPAGLLQIPVDAKINEDCKARDFWKKVNVNADTWCRERCSSGPCPLDYCEKACIDG